MMCLSLTVVYDLPFADSDWFDYFQFQNRYVTSPVVALSFFGTRSVKKFITLGAILFLLNFLLV
ncbi:MAG: hypothetical protein ACJAXM_001507 [Arenicella sp.]|jgi:hypothetical protein